MSILTAWSGKSRLIPEGVRLLVERARAAGYLTSRGDPQPTPWSLCRLGLDDADYETLKAWFKTLDRDHVRAFLGSSQERQYPLRSAQTTIDVGNEAAFGLLFLALAAETARRHDSLNNVWPFVASLECGARGLIFTPNGHPTGDVKDAIKAAVARFGLRHVRSVQKQEYYQTVLLQIGLPEGMFASLPSLLAGTRALPEAVKALLDPVSGDSTFKQLWTALKRARGQDASLPPAEDLRTSPWLRAGTLNQVVQILSTAHAEAPLDESSPFAPGRVLRETLRLSVVPRRFRPDFPLTTGQSRVDAVINGRRVCRYVLRDGSFDPVVRDPIEMPCEAEVVLELRYADGSSATLPRSLVLWDEDAAVIELPADDQRVTMLLFDSEQAPDVTPNTARVEPFGERWLVCAEGECTIRVNGEVVWSAGQSLVEDIDLRINLLTPFGSQSRGEIVVDVPLPWRVSAVFMAGVPFVLERLDVQGTSVVASAQIPDPPTEPTVRTRVVIDGPRGSKTLVRGVPIRAGTWSRESGSWQYIEPTAQVDLNAISNARRLRFSVPGIEGVRASLLAGDLRLGPLIDSNMVLTEPPLGYGEPLVAWDGKQIESRTFELCSAVVNRSGARLETRGDSLRFVLGQPLAYFDPARHRFVIWLRDGTLRSLYVRSPGDETPIREIQVPAESVAVALCVGASRQAAAWADDWSRDIAIDPPRAHAALLAIRAFGLPFLMHPHRARVAELTERYPGLTARAWLARDPTYAAPTDALDGLLEQRDDSSQEIWLSAIRQLLEPTWCQSYASEARAGEVLDELRRASADPLLGDYRKASRRLFPVGPRTTLGLCDNVWQKTDELRDALRTNVGNDLCGEPTRRRGRLTEATEPLVAAAAASLGVSVLQLRTLLSLDPTSLPYRSAIHDEEFRRLALRHLLLEERK